jgi:hypothetical protein
LVHADIISIIQYEAEEIIKSIALKTQFDTMIHSWQGRQSVDQIFDDEVDFDIDEIREILGEPIVDLIVGFQ